MFIAGGGAKRATGYSLDDLLRALADRQRRQVLFHLYGQDNPVTLADIVVAITAGQYSNSNADITSEKEDMVRLSLRLNLPILADAGLVKHNSTTDEVSLTDFARELRPYIYPFIVAESPDALLDI